MAYTTLERVKLELEIPTEQIDRDDILELLIEEAEAYVDLLTGTTFEADALTTRSFNADSDIDSNSVLYFDAWLATTTGCTVTNGNSEDITSDCVFYPTNETPKYAVKPKSEAWEYDSDGYAEEAISIQGYWGWSSSVPVQIREITSVLAASLFKARDNPDARTVTYAEGGQLIIPDAWPRRIWEVCMRYRRHPLGAH